MKKNLNLFSLCCALVTLSTGVISAEEPKIGSVNIDALLNEYYRVPIEKEKLAAELERAKAEESVVAESLKKTSDELVALKEKITDSVTSKTEKDQLTKEYQSKLNQANIENKKRLAVYERRSRAFNVHKISLLKSMRNDVMQIAAEYSEKAGYDLVIDRSGITNMGLPSILYSKRSTDIHSEVLKVLNDAAPAEKADE
ncbi:OmpH family outer membrane protein [Akkermansiaceae bacterium]|nr:OmpH family outer membrane protein [Akkermansiaceae bacterium]